MAVIPAAAGLVITGVFGLISVAQEVNKITEKKKPSNRLRKWSARYEVALLYAARFIPNMSGVEKDVYRVAYKWAVFYLFFISLLFLITLFFFY